MPRSTRRDFTIRSAMAALFGALGPGIAAAEPARALAPGAAYRGTPWRNWSGALQAQPARRVAPRSEAELANFLRGTRGPMRPVGAGHSFSPLVPTDGHLLVLDQLNGILDADPKALTATIGAGTRLGDLGPALDAIGQAMPNLPDIDRQTLAGALSTATHGTGLGFTSLSATVQALRLVTAQGEVLDLDATRDAATFAAACVSLGALGVITRATLRNRTPLRLKETARAAKTEDVLATFEREARAHRHYEMFPLVHSDYAILQVIDETDEPVHNPPASPEEAAAFDQAMASWLQLPVRERRAVINATAEQLPPQVTIDASFRVLANVRNARFNEMEYSVPLAAGADCLREILATIAAQEFDIAFPLEYRYVAGDDLWLSMFEGGPRASISVHQFAHLDHRPYFALVEPIFRKYGGRPHWGKVHSLGATQLRALYPRFDDFAALRTRLDPQGKLLNPHLRHLFGLPG